MRGSPILCRMVLFAGILLGQTDIMLAATPVQLREIKLMSPNEVGFSYQLTGPLKRAEILFSYAPSFSMLDSIQVKFGNGKQVRIPSSILRCFPDAIAESAFFLAQATDEQYPASGDAWWASINVPYGRKLSPEKANDPDPTVVRHIYPYVGFQIIDWKLSVILLQKSSRESRTISISGGTCPVSDLTWSLSMGSAH